MGRAGPMSYLRPDGKSQVTIQYDHGRPVRVDTVVISTQHADYIDHEQVRQDVIDHIIKPIIPVHLLDSNTKIFVNPTGRFVTGGPMGDAGLTGRKIIVDTMVEWLVMAEELSVAIQAGRQVPAATMFLANIACRVGGERSLSLGLLPLKLLRHDEPFPP